MQTLQKQDSLASHLYCSNCKKEYPVSSLHSYAFCCNKPLLVAYHSNHRLDKGLLRGRVNSMWRYQEMLPLFDTRFKVSLGEGFTPMVRLNKLEKTFGFDHLTLKDEGINPTGSFKCRGISMALSKAKELGVKKCVIPTAGNAGVAMSAYAAAAGLEAIVIMPSNTPQAFKDACLFHGADLIFTDGLIDQCGELAAEIGQQTGAFNFSTLKEPYRLEGKKTIGYEIAEQFDWELPDVIIYPTGGGTGLIGIWKAFHEMEELGWISVGKLPRMIVVQSSICSPVVDYINKGAPEAHYGSSVANGLSVPKAFGQALISRVVSESGGCAISVEEKGIVPNTLEIMKSEGLSICPEGGTVWMGLKQLVELELVGREERILLINTGNADKYVAHFQDYL